VIQLYISKKNFDVQKAERFFKERRIPVQVMDFALSLALFKAGSRSPARMAIMAITTRSSMSVKRVFFMIQSFPLLLASAGVSG